MTDGEPGLMPSQQPWPPDHMDAWYTPCPLCGLIGPAGSADYQLTGPGGTVDWSVPALVTCIPCGRRHSITAESLLVPDTDHTCSRCCEVTRVPAAAAEVVCLNCRLFAHGPATRTDADIAERLAMTTMDHMLEQQQRVQAAKDRRRAAGGTIPWETR